MKKILIGVFLLVSVLSFSSERVVKLENAYVDDKGIVYVIGEKAPFTGIVENYKVPPISEGDSVLEGKIPFKNGVMEGYSKLYYSNGKLKVELPLDKNGLVNGIVKIYYPSGKIMSEKSYKDDKLEGTVKKYDESGKIISEEFYKNGNKIK